jgi:hypothetical protein
VGMYNYLFVLLVVVVLAWDPKVLFVECITMTNTQSTNLVCVGLVD